MNTLLAVFGTAIVESTISSVFRVHTLSAILGKEYLLSAMCACSLGYLVYRRWQAVSAKWIWVIGVSWLAFRAIPLMFAEHTSAWSALSGSGCADTADGCMNWFVFTIPSLRLTAYSAGAALCSRLGHNDPHTIEDAWLGGFRRLPSPLSDNETSRKDDTGPINL